MLERSPLIDTAEFARVFSSWQERIREAITSRPSGAEWALVGIKRRGAILARRLWRDLSSSERQLLYGEIDISLYRDDYHLKTERPIVLGTEITFRVDGVCILLVDDVLFTGRTVRAAMDLILDFGRPRVISLAVLVDRGHRELPIAADHVGRTVNTAAEDRVRVTLKELGETDAVELERARS